MAKITVYVSNLQVDESKYFDIDLYMKDFQPAISVNKEFNNVKIDSIEYKSYIRNKDLTIAYFETPQLNSRNNLDILDFSWQLSNNNENLIVDNAHVYSETNQSFSSPHKHILITDKVSAEDNVPLWYVHDSEIITNVTSIQKFESFYKPKVNGSSYLIDNGKLYTNFQNTYDFKNDSYVFYKVTGITNSGETVTELLNLKPAFTEASWEDIDGSGDFKNDIYTVEEKRGYWNFNVFFKGGFTSRMCNNGLNEYYWKPDAERILKIKNTNAIYSSDPWNLRVQNSSVYQGDYKYCVPEYLKQPYSPIYPCIKQNEKTCIKVTSNILKIPSSKIYFDSNQNIHLDLILFDKDENPTNAYTTDSSKHDNLYSNGIKYVYGAISSIDQSNAFIEMSSEVLATAITVKCTYYESVSDFVYLNLDLNPVNNKKLENNKTVIYLKPQKQDTIYNSNWRAIEHLVVDKEDKIIAHSNYNSTSLNFDLKYSDFLNNYFVGNDNLHQFLLLAEVYYKDESKLDDCLSFDMRKFNKYFEASDANYKKNYKLQLSRYGFGDSGMPLELSSLVYLQVPHDMTQEQITSNYLPADFTILADEYVPNLDFKIIYNFGNNKILRFNFEGTGIYTIKNSNNAVIYTHEFNTVIKQSYIDVKTNVSSDSFVLEYVPADTYNYSKTSYSQSIKCWS